MSTRLRTRLQLIEIVSSGYPITGSAARRLWRGVGEGGSMVCSFRPMVAGMGSQGFWDQAAVPSPLSNALPPAPARALDKPALSPLIAIPPGKLRLGRNVEVIEHPFFLSRFPVTNREYGEYLQAMRNEIPEKIRDPKRADQPVTGVSYYDADAYAKWRTEKDGHPWRLPWAEEWLYAAMGEEGRFLPWGKLWDRNYVSLNLSEPDPVGRHPEGATPLGVEEMVGNVLEWVKTRHASGKAMVLGGVSWKERPSRVDEMILDYLFTERSFVDLSARLVKAMTRADDIGLRLASDVPLGFTPPEMVRIDRGGRVGGNFYSLDPFWIGKYPVTNLEYRWFLEAHRREIPPDLLDPDKCHYPVTEVNVQEAQDYCHWLSHVTQRSYRLPNELEWKVAAMGPEGWAFPWGNSWVDANAAFGLSEPAPVHAHPGGISFYGVGDMVGNVEEWTDPERSGVTVVLGTIHWQDGRDNVDAALYSPFFKNPNFLDRSGVYRDAKLRSPTIGFRIAI